MRVLYNTVQEQSATNWAANSVGTGVSMASGAPTVNIRFTGWSLLGGTGTHFHDSTDGTTPTAFTHSHFSGGQFTISPGSVALTNCVWERVSVKLQDDDEAGREWDLFNNLFYGGTLFYRARGDDPTLRAYDNLFDQTAITRAGGSDHFTHGYNGYVGIAHLAGTSAGGDKDITWPADYQTGPLGNFYYPTTGGNLSTLIDAGSRPVEDAGLPGYTVQTNQAPDLCTVDIGYHYPSVVLITGNNASLGGGPIQTYDFATGNLVNSFVPQSAGNGRGLAIKGTEIFYTQLSDDAIHVCTYGTDGSGGTTDTRTLLNTWRPGVSNQDLAFLNGDLYVLTGYPNQQLQVFKLDPTTVAVLGGPISIGSPASPGSDGFTVLPNGDFLINEGDSSPFYDEYDGTTGSYISGGLSIDLLTTYGFFNGTGVATAPDGQSL
jgi:hypothetical protein